MSAKPAKAAHGGTTESLPPEVKAELDDAEKQIDSNPQEAIRMARHTLQEAKSARAFSIVTRAFCKLGDLGNAKAGLHNVGGERARVIKYCKAAGTDLQ
jgi:serine/threonine-protein kinase